jgi:hypothetical protein
MVTAYDPGTYLDDNLSFFLNQLLLGSIIVTTLYHKFLRTINFIELLFKFMRNIIPHFSIKIWTILTSVLIKPLF